MKKKVFVVYRSSKGRKDVVCVFDCEDSAKISCAAWTLMDSDLPYKVNYRYVAFPFYQIVY